MLVEAVTFFLGVSILFYCLFAGADFGGGILEIFAGSRKREEQREIISHAIAPVWEANHVWLVLAVVILFNGFPKAYGALSTIFHIPLTLMLVGVILRGCAFTFRHYDAVQDRSQKAYSLIFKVSSVLTPLMLGVVAGGMLLERYSHHEAGFVAHFVDPWLNLFSFATGLLTCAIFAFLAAVYLVGEAEDAEVREIFTRRARVANIAVILAGTLVFGAAEWDGFDLIGLFGHDAVTDACMIAATLVLVPLWAGLKRGRRWSVRVLAALQMSLILVGWFRVQYPMIVGTISIFESAAPAATLRALLYALVAGIALIFPAVFYLMWIFKKRGPSYAHASRPR